MRKFVYGLSVLSHCSVQHLVNLISVPHLHAYCSFAVSFEINQCQSMGSLSQTQLSDFTFIFHFHALEKEMATHSSVLAWRLPGTGEPGGLPSLESHRVRHNSSSSIVSLSCVSCISSVAQSCPTLCNPMDCSTPGFPVHHQLPEPTQTHVHCVSNAIQPSHPLSSPSLPAFNLSRHQGLFQ